MMEPFYKSITDFIFLENEPAEAALIFLPGGPSTAPALRAAQLWHDGYAPLIVVSGRYSILNGSFQAPHGEGTAYAAAGAAPGEDSAGTECAFLTELLVRRGVRKEAILQEPEAQYTYQNAQFSRALLDRMGIFPERAILCCQAFHARRAWLYYQEQFPETRILVCPSVTEGISRESWHRTPKGIDTVLGEVERCGWQFHEIMRAYM